LEQVIIDDYFNPKSKRNTKHPHTNFNKQRPIYHLDSDGSLVLIN